MSRFISRANVLSAILLFGSVVVGFTIVELALRFSSGTKGWENTGKANILRNFEFEFQLGDLYQSSSSSVLYKRNEFGLRDKCGTQSEIDILTVGGSTTDQRYVDIESTYQIVLENALKQSIESFGCVSNAGVDGHTTYGHLFAFENWFPLIPNLKPKLVLLYIGVNDADFVLNGDKPRIGFDTINTSTVSGWLKDLYITQRLLPLYRYIRDRYANSERAYAEHSPARYTIEDYSVSRLNSKTQRLSKLNSEAFEGRLTQILLEVDEMGSKPLCVTQPHRYVKIVDGRKLGIESVMGSEYSGLDYDYSIRELIEKMKEVCGPYFIDLYSGTFVDEHFYDGVHTTQIGSEFIGRRIYEHLQDTKLIDVLR